MPLILQDIILNECRREKLKVEIEDVNGKEYKGVIRGFDNFSIIVDLISGVQVMFYKDNIVLIQPERPVLVDGYEKKEG